MKAKFDFKKLVGRFFLGLASFCEFKRVWFPKKMNRGIAISIVMVMVALFAVGTGFAKAKQIDFWMMLYTDYKTQNELIGDLAKDFEAETGIKVNYEFINWAQAREKMTMMSLGGEAPDVADAFWSFTFSDMGAGKHGPMPIEDYIDKYIPDLEERWFASSLGDVKYKGHLYGVPWRIDVRPLVYRKDFLEQAGLDPEALDTWDDLVVYGKKLTKKDASGKVVRWGVGIGGDLAQYYYNWIWQAGGSFLNEDYTEATLDTEAGREALQFLVDLVHKHKVAPIDPALDPSYDWLGEYSANHLAILPLTSPIKQFIEHNAPHLTEVTIARRPPKNKLRVSFQGAGYFGLLYGTKDVDAAMQWLAFLAKTDVQKRIAITTGKLSPCRPVLDDPYYREDWWFKGHTKALPYGRTTQHPNPAWGAITNPKPGAPIYDMMVNALSGRVSVEEAIKTAQEGMQELIRSYVKEKK